MKKIVGISFGGGTDEGVYRLNANYIKSIIYAGAIPVMLLDSNNEDIVQMVELCDGIVLSGGPDIDPVIYGEETLPECGKINAERDAFEIKLAKLAVQKGKSVLGICRGVQVLNVSFGGTLWQDIPTQLENPSAHATVDGKKAENSVVITDDKITDKIGLPGKRLLVNSFHHQAVKRVADGFKVMALSETDGVIEGIYMPGKNFVVGVQWHPELMSDVDKNMKAMFDAFIRSL